ncbi:hypothetical protein NIA69_11835 [Gemmiger formicilis]|nr:hypothetical protein [Gemmiger formicilis]
MVEKMKLVRVQGTMPQLNEFIGSCCMDGRFDLEPATRYMSESLGYGALNEENPTPRSATRSRRWPKRPIWSCTRGSSTATRWMPRAAAI